MKLSLDNIINCQLQCQDGAEGYVKDFLFDQNTWKIQYAEVDIGGILTDKKLLVPVGFINKWNLENRALNLNIKKSQLESCPTIDKKLPISRKYEQELHDHYQEVPYWNKSTAPSVAMPMEAFPPRPINTPDMDIEEDELDTQLRSFREIRGYHIKANDGEIGHVEDAIMDGIDRQIVYLIIDTSNWLPLSKRVLISVNWMNEISYKSQSVSIDMDRDAIKDAPEFDPDMPVNSVYEKKLYNYYGVPVD